MSAYNPLFRTGGAADSLQELLLRSLNDARGSAVEAVPGTVAWVEDMALARVMFAASEAVRRLAYQFDPLRMTAFLERWENILKIVPGIEATDNERRRTVAAKFALIGTPPFVQNVKDYLDALIGNVYVETLRINSADAETYVPNGVVIPGGITIPAGEWSSTVSHIPIRVAQPLAMIDAEFYSTVGSFKPFLYDYLPAYVSFDWGRFCTVNGTISLPNGSDTVTGTGTLFLTDPGGAIEIGEEIEVYDNAGVLVTVTVVSVETDTSLTVTTYNGTSITNKEWKRFGFFLDAVQNVDNAFLD